MRRPAARPSASPRYTRKDTAAIVRDHLALCRNPMADLPTWMALDKKRPLRSRPAAKAKLSHAPNQHPRFRRLQPHRQGQAQEPVSQRRYNVRGRNAKLRKLLCNTLHELSGRMGPNNDRAGAIRGLSGGPGAGNARPCVVQHVSGGQTHSQPQTQTLSADPPPGDATHAEGDSELAGIQSHFTTLIAAARLTMRPADAARIVANLKIQKILAIRALKQRKIAERAKKSLSPPSASRLHALAA